MGKISKLSALRRMTDHLTGEPYLLHPQTGQQFRRTVCALAWPMPPYPGCITVVGEARHLPTVLGEPRHLWTMLEYQSPSQSDIITTVEQVLWRYQTPRVITPVDDDRYLLIEVHNDARRAERKPPIRIDTPIRWHGKGEGLMPYYLSLLQRRLVDDKTLHMGQFYAAQDEYRMAQGNDDGVALMRASMSSWPALCALCWCIEAVDMQGDPMGLYAMGSGLPSGHADPLGGY